MANGGVWEAPLNALLLSLLRSSGLNCSAIPVFDVGANLGAFTLFAAAQGCRLWAFEMQPYIATLLELSLRVNGYRPQVTLYNAPVWNATGVPIAIRSYDGNFGGAEAHEAQKGDAAVAHTIQIKDVYDGDISFLKLDVEKAEEQALRGMGSLLTERRVKHFVMELRHAHRELVTWLYDIGYHCGLYERTHFWSRAEIAQLVEDIEEGRYTDAYCTPAPIAAWPMATPSVQ